MSMTLLLNATAVLNSATMPNSTIASYAVSTTNLELTKSAHAYRPWFENGAWQGDLVQYDLSSTGSISTSVDLSTTPPANTTNINGAVNWSARLQFDKKYNNNNTYYKNKRKIVTTTGEGVNAKQIPFIWSLLSEAQQTSLDLNPANANESNILNFIRGDRSNEINGVPGGLLRQRYSILGDIIHTDPVYVANPDSLIFDSGYALYKSQNKTRAPRIYAGANDGMLHVFNALTGDEVYAYIPSMLIKKLNLLSKVPYQHQYYVDGALSAGDMDFGNQSWHSILVGSLGAGGKGLFALDISNPDLTSQSSTTNDDTKVLWEIDFNNPNIGHIYDKVEIVKLPDGNWYIVTGNGYGSTNDVASLLLISSKGVVTTIEADNAIIANGLSRPTIVDTNGDGTVDFAYAGDIQGNLYRFDLNSKSKAEKIFSAGINKPITTAPKVTNLPIGGRVILFGTGSLLSNRDVNDISIQSIYGIRDYDKATFINSSKLITRALSTNITYTNPVSAQVVSLRTIEKNPLNPVTLDWATKDGWQLDLPAGERVVLDPNLRAARFQVMSTNPTLNETWLIQLNFHDGAIKKIFYDLNADQVFDAKDTVNFSVDTLGNQTGPGDIPVAIKQGKGFFSRQLITRIKNGVDANFINGLNLPVIDVPKTGNVEQGFALGHIDVDTDSPLGSSLAENLSDQYCYEKGNRISGVKIDAAGVLIPPSRNSPFVRTGTGTGDGLSGKTDGHAHEYDKKHGTVDIDYINLELRCKQKRADNGGIAKPELNRVTEVAIGNATKFFVIAANADLSPGSELNIGTDSWNIVVYQKLIQEKLDAWNAAGAVATDFPSMMLDDGKSLIFTLDQILATVNAGPGKFSNSFNNKAIMDGGLHPTRAGCVKKNANITNGRWRNGALTIQLIDANKYTKDPSTVLKQIPTDLPQKILINGIGTIDLKVAGKMYGGLYANNYKLSIGIRSSNTAFLYESTLFWHFGNLSELVNKTKPCYGDPGWELAKTTEIAGLTSAQLTTLLDTPSNKLGKANLDLIKAIKNGAPQSIIDGLQKTYDKELNKIKDYVHNPETAKINNTDPTLIVGSPIKTLDTTTLNPFILGPGSTMGRRSWIDIQP